VVSRRVFAIGLVGACVLSAAVGTGTTLLLAERGPAGPQGAPGPQGSPGPGTEDAQDALTLGEALEWRFGELEAEILSVGNRLSELELARPAGYADELRELEEATLEVCYSLELAC
jgi:hypothetical protein